MWSGLDARVRDNLSEAARAARRHALLEEISTLCAAPLYERFVKARKAGAPPAEAQPRPHAGTARYDLFVADMQAGGFRRLFEDKPVLLRLIATFDAAVDRYVARICPPPRCRSAGHPAAIFCDTGAAGRVAGHRRRSFRSA